MIKTAATPDGAILSEWNFYKKDMFSSAVYCGADAGPD